ncbi:MAG: KEOPS complex Pcc1-like subunit [Halodesulfurarchaeum sp.]|nr:KEOPS complex Pcc1-like subunit [Halodesulfurarchaeum sp.]
MTRCATIRSTVDRPDAIAEAIKPDNTTEMDTAVDGDAIVTSIERDSTAGLRSTVDDYVVNLTVALEVARTANRHATNDEPINT